jgi:hypothetical protein
MGCASPKSISEGLLFTALLYPIQAIQTFSVTAQIEAVDQQTPTPGE